jgi:[acyl-carrier-protein] S-malonyltransferase
MAPAAEGLRRVLREVEFRPPGCEVWSNVTAEPHDPHTMELLKDRLVEQLLRPVRWAQTCERLVSRHPGPYHELAPGAVLRGLMRRIDRNAKVESHDEP